MSYFLPNTFSKSFFFKVDTVMDYSEPLAWESQSQANF